MEKGFREEGFRVQVYKNDLGLREDSVGCHSEPFFPEPYTFN
jgi:hypothetical protein